MTNQKTPAQGGATEERIEAAAWEHFPELETTYVSLTYPAGAMRIISRSAFVSGARWAAALSASVSADPADEHHDAAQRLRAAFGEYLGTEMYWCTRDHSAWGYGTMQLDDFELARDNEDIIESLVDIALKTRHDAEERPYSEATDIEYGAWDTDSIEEHAQDMLAVVRHRRSLEAREERQAESEDHAATVTGETKLCGPCRRGQTGCCDGNEYLRCDNARTVTGDRGSEHGTLADEELLARLMDTLAYYHCRSTNPKADHPSMGYHAFSEEQREWLREKQREAAEEVLRMWRSHGVGNPSGDREKLIAKARKLAAVAVKLGGTGRLGPSWETMREYEEALNDLCDALAAPVEARDVPDGYRIVHCLDCFEPALAVEGERARCEPCAGKAALRGEGR